VSLAVFQSIGPTELIIVLVIVLVIFGPKRLPGLGRSLGSGMREFRDSVTGKGSDRDLDEDEDDDDDESRRQANAALGRAEETPPVDGEVVSDRETSRS
jgi:sec-independent protein translocase protein TatA